MNPFLVDGGVAAGAVGPRGLLRRGLLLADLGHSVSEWDKVRICLVSNIYNSKFPSSCISARSRKLHLAISVIMSERKMT